MQACCCFLLFNIQPQQKHDNDQRDHHHFGIKTPYYCAELNDLNANKCNKHFYSMNEQQYFIKSDKKAKKTTKK